MRPLLIYDGCILMELDSGGFSSMIDDEYMKLRSAGEWYKLLKSKHNGKTDKKSNRNQ